MNPNRARKPTLTVLTALLLAPLAALRATEPPALWNATKIMPRASALPQMEGAEFHVLQKQRPDEDGCNGTLGVGLVWHKGKLFAS